MNSLIRFLSKTNLLKGDLDNHLVRASMVIIYFFFVETKGRTLEELDAIFEAKNPRKASTMKTTLRHRVVKEEGGEKRVSVEAV